MENNAFKVSIGSHVALNLLDRAGNKERMEIDIVQDESADYIHSFLGVSTPLVKVLLGECAGSVIPYLKEDLLAVEVLSVAPSTSKPPENSKEKRQSLMEKAIREVEHTNAVVFASSFSGKWGDYDPDSLPKEISPEEKETGG